MAEAYVVARCINGSQTGSALLNGESYLVLSAPDLHFGVRYFRVFAIDEDEWSNQPFLQSEDKVWRVKNGRERECIGSYSAARFEIFHTKADLPEEVKRIQARLQYIGSKK
jgi:hypothetical protein